MYVDIKQTIWYRYHIDEDLLPEDFLNKPKEELEYALLHFDFVKEQEENGYIIESSENITVEENGCQATVELFTDDDTLIWNNER